MSIQWPEEAILVQKNQSYTFYSYFVSNHNGRQYKCGDIITVRIDKLLLLAEITHIWVTDGNKENGGQVRLQLYLKPEDLPHGRTHYHGEHEILQFHKPAIVSSFQLLQMEQRDYDWSTGIPLQVPQPTRPSPSPVSSSSSTAMLYCNETMVPLGGFDDHIDTSPATSPVFARNSLSYTSQLKIISYSAYCRYRALLKRFEPNPFPYMSQPLVLAMGGIPVPPSPTLVLFCRKTCRDMTLERKILVLEGKISADEVYQEHMCNGDLPPPLKRRRGRPRKTTVIQPLARDDDTTIVKRKRGRPRKALPADDNNESNVKYTSLSPSSSSATDRTNESPTSTLQQDPITHNNTVNSTAPPSHADNESISLRPRSTLQPPLQYRDDSIYDLNPIDTLPLAKKPSLPTEPSVSQQASPANGITITPVNTVSPTPPPVVTSSISSRVPVPIATPSPVASSDVKQLLKAHLSRMQKLPVSTDPKANWTETMLTNLEDHLLEEKAFLELLFCFMKMRSTPINRIPRLGSRNINLYHLFKSTSQLGGYDQVTLNRKWSSVFDSMGCSSGMTCASTVTRKHYEKLLLPFEKALNVMKQNAHRLK